MNISPASTQKACACGLRFNLIYRNQVDILNRDLAWPCYCVRRKKHCGIGEWDLMSTVVLIDIYIQYVGGI